MVLEGGCSDKMKYGLSTGRRAQHQWRTAMEEYIGLDVSMKETAVAIRRDGVRVWRGK
jgi:transposase